MVIFETFNKIQNKTYQYVALFLVRNNKMFAVKNKMIKLKLAGNN